MPWLRDETTGESFYEGYTLAAALAELPPDQLVHVEVRVTRVEEADEEEEEDRLPPPPPRSYRRRTEGVLVDYEDWLPFYDHGVKASTLLRQLRREGAGRHFDRLAREIDGEEIQSSFFHIYLLGEWPRT